MNQTETSLKGWGLLSKYRVELMGFSIIWIILFHGYRNNMIFPGKLNILNFIFSKGDCGVEIFLLLSGLGLYYSFSKNPDLSCFYKNRIKRVILPYLLVSGGFWVGQDLIYHKSISAFVKNITLYSFWRSGYTRLWYFALLIPLYLIFPILYYYIYGKQGRSKKQVLLRSGILIILVLFLNLSVRYLSKSYYTLIESALSRIVIFLLGILVGSYAKRNENVSYGTIVFFILAYSTQLYDYENDMGDMFRRCWYIPLSFVVCFVLIYFFELLKLKAKPTSALSKILTMAGKYSLELYIVHIWMRKIIYAVPIDYHFHGINLNKFGIFSYCLVIISSLIITFFFAQMEKLLFGNRVSTSK
ncbi:MAG: acyltransferase family protein [Lachnospiraceae bacterium]